MDKSAFFSSLEWNLGRLAAEAAPLPECGLPSRYLKAIKMFGGVFRARRLDRVSDTNPPAPADVKVWDLVGKRLLGGRPLKFRVFACYSESADPEEFRKVKFELRKWYQLCGLNSGHDLPYSGALVIGSGETIGEGAVPKGVDLPECVVIEMWACSGGTAPKFRTFGDGVGQVVTQALVPETFAECEKRVIRAVKDEVGFGKGHVTVESVAEKTGVGEGVISNIFMSMVACGDYSLGKLPSRKECGGHRTKAQRMYIERRIPGFFQRLMARKMGKWYVQDGFVSVCAFSAVGALLWLADKFAFKFLSEPVISHPSAALCVGITLLAAIAGVGFIIMRKK